MTDAERCRQEIEAAESAVRDRCGFGPSTSESKE